MGTKTVTVAGLVGSIVLYFSLVFSTEFELSSLFYLIEFPMLGLFMGLFQMALSAHVSDREVADMADGMSLLYVGGNLGYTVGPILGGLLVTISGYGSLFALGFAMTIASLIIIQKGIRENPKFAVREHHGFKDAGRNQRFKPGVFLLIVLIFLSWFAIAYQAIPLSTFEARYLDISSLEIGVLLGTNGALITIFQSYISRRIRIERNRKLYSVAIGSVLMAAGYIAVSLSRTFVSLEVAITITTFGEILIAVPTQVVLTMFSGRHNRGRYQGYYFASSRAGSSVSVFAALIIFSLLGNYYVRGWYIVAFICIICAVAYTILSRTIEAEYRTFSDTISK